jgi:hypothetical protein
MVSRQWDNTVIWCYVRPRVAGLAGGGAVVTRSAWGAGTER